jgi:choline dehydrogenase-like flavoprotein
MAKVFLKDGHIVKLKDGIYSCEELKKLGLHGQKIVKITLTPFTNIFIDSKQEYEFENDTNKKKSFDVCIKIYKCSVITVKTENTEPLYILLGVGCAGSYLLNKISKKYRVLAFEAGVDRRNDAFTYNLALLGPAVHNKLDKVSPRTTYPIPPGQPATFNWFGVFLSLPWTGSTTTQLANPAIPTPQVWNQGVMIGGSNEHIQGVYVNPSRELFRRWTNILDDRYKFENLFPKMLKMENFRYTTIPTTQTWDGLDYAPYDGPSVMGSRPIHRGYNGVLQVIQSNPASFSLTLSKAIYNRFIEEGYDTFKQYPTVEDKCSVTFNSGTNICVTTATETFLDVHRTRSSLARGYLNNSVMETVNHNLPADIASGNYLINNYAANGGIINKGPYVGINGHNFTLTLDTTIQRIVFKTKRGFPPGEVYWIPNYTVDPNAFVKPLKAIGIEYVDKTTSAKVFVKSTDIICTLGVLATPIVLMQSGIGPAALLKSLGIPVLLDQPNLGRYISNHEGAILRWTTTSPSSVWGNVAVGTDASNGYLPGSDDKIKRKFQYFSSFTPASPNPPAANPPIPPNKDNWSVNLYDLHPKSTGYVEPLSAYEGNTTSGLLNLKIYPNYYSDPYGEDKANLCWIARQVFKAVINADPGAEFFWPGPNSIFFADDETLWTALMLNFTAQAHYVGSCGMAKDPEYSCVDQFFLLRGTKNVRVCDASSMPLEKDENGVVYPIQNDGNTTRGVNAISVVFKNQLLENI